MGGQAVPALTYPRPLRYHLAVFPTTSSVTVQTRPSTLNSYRGARHGSPNRRRATGTPARDHPRLVHVRLGQLRLRHQRRSRDHTHLLRLPLQGGSGRRRLLSRHHLHGQLHVEHGRGRIHGGRCAVESGPGHHRRPRSPEEDPPDSLRSRRIALHRPRLLLGIHISPVGVAHGDVHAGQRRLRRKSGLLQLISPSHRAPQSPRRCQQQRVRIRLRRRRTAPANPPRVDSPDPGHGCRRPRDPGVDSIHRRVVVRLGRSGR